MKNWYFPLENGIGYNGVSDSGVETFRGSLMSSLTREICQNSLDAVYLNQPVKIIFKKHMVDSKNIPGLNELKEVFNAGSSFWTKNHNKKGTEFFNQGQKILNSNKIPVLQISDFNTTGLIGSNDNGEITPWVSMVKSDGISDKKGSNGGCFGIGKSSIYATSDLHIVFFKTLDKFGIEAAEGVAKLPTFERNSKRYFGKGFFGNIAGSQSNCCKEIVELNNIYKREQTGTDIFVIGFNDDNQWKDKIICSLLDNFLLAIYKGKLIVEVDDVTINSKTLSTLLDKYKNDKTIHSALFYYDVLTSSDSKVISTSDLFPKLKGEITLTVKLFKESTNRSVLISRSNGMKLFDRKNISGSIQFSAILTMEGDQLNAYFAKMENPAHNNWESDRYWEENASNLTTLRKEAEKNKTKLYRWIKEQVLKVGETFYGDEVEIAGLEGIIPEFYDMGTNKNEALSNKSKQIVVKKREKNKASLNIKTINDGDDFYEVDTPGVIDPDGDKDTLGTPINPTSKEGGGKGATTKGEENPNGNRIIKTYKPVNNFNRRIFISNASNSEYTMIIKTNQTLDDCLFQIFIAGDSSSINCDIISAFCQSTNKSLEVKENTIKLPKMTKGFDYKIKFNISTPYVCSLGVKLYANNK